MKKFIVFFVIMTASLFSQGWNNVVQTAIPFDNLVGLDLFTNKDGNHILVTNLHVSGGIPGVRTNTLKYYLLNSSGSIIRSYTLENFQGDIGGIQFASIEGTDDRIYIVYKLGINNLIKTRKSTNAGQSWSNIADINIGNNTCNNIDITFGKDDNALHVVWATQDAGSDYKTYYMRLPLSNQWDAQQTVTDGVHVGGFPTVSKSQNRVHVSYNTGNQWSPVVNLGDAKLRDKYISTWQTPQLVFSTESFRERVHAGNSKLFDFYYKLETGMGQYSSDLYVRERSLSGTSWSSPLLLKTHASVYEIVSASNTYNENTHIVYEIGGGVGYRSYNGSSWSSEFTVGEGYNSPKIYTVSNDLFIVWGKNWPNDQYIQYRQFNAAPLAPQNVAVGPSSQNHPLLTWASNKEADLKEYKIYKKTTIQGTWVHLATTSGTSYEDATEIYLTGAHQAFEHNVDYRISAIDIQLLESAPSASVTARVKGAPLDKKGSDGYHNITEYNLEQNYPNPFNPVTQINYQVKADGFVELKVYDILGNEITALVNEVKSEGYYSVQFDAGNLPSGVYIYSLRVNDFIQNQKMTLTK
jgi:hypothetical protein